MWAGSLASALDGRIAMAEEAVFVGQSWPTEFQVPIGRIDHRPWSKLLRRYAGADGNVNYGAWKTETSEVRKLDLYLAQVSRAGPGLEATKDEQIAFWINAYNALMVRGVLREYPIATVRNASATRFGFNIWQDLRLIVGGDHYSLQRIENEVLPRFDEPRVYFCICKAAGGSAGLWQRAYVPQQLDAQLTFRVREFFADRTKFRYDLGRKELRLSPILKAHAAEFGATRREQLAQIAHYLPDGDARRLATQADTSIRYLNYDWSLNDEKALSLSRKHNPASRFLDR